METLEVNLENCYGIKQLKHPFDFKNGKKTQVIYASNGSMKTSFAKAFKDMRNAKDLIFQDRRTVVQIKVDDNISLLQDDIFVIRPYEEDYKKRN